MQIESLKAADFMRKSETANGLFGDYSSQTPVKEDKDVNLRSIQIDSANYNKSGKREKDFESDLQIAEAVSGQQKANIDYISKEWGDEAVDKMEEDGISGMSSDSHTFITVVDQIKMNLAKGGADISKMGGLSDEEISKMSGNVSAAVAMSREISSQLSDETISYLVDNQLEPTIENVYNASFAAPSGMSASMNGSNNANSIPSEIIPQVEKTIEEAGLEVNDESMQIVEKMFESEVAITPENISYTKELSEFVKPEDESEILGFIKDALEEGRDAKEAYILPGYSLMDKARNIYNDIQSIDENKLADIKATRQLQEVRLMMTVEANFSLLKRGISLDTANLADLVEKLTNQEKALERQMLTGFGEEISEAEIEQRISLYEETTTTVSELKDMPAALLGRIPDINIATMRDLHTEGRVLADTFAKAQETYEALWTAPRKDMGDSIAKAFRNVDDILEDLGIDSSAANEKAVRVLAYNHLEINLESVNSMKNATEQVDRMFKTLTPSVVSEMIKKNVNPLDMKMEDLMKVARDIKSEMGNASDDEGFAKFLWKAEQNNNISKSERDAYIGIYRLIHQVEKSDGAAIGALVHQGTEVTLRNLMTAVRNKNHSHREYEIDDSFGGLEQLNVKDLSITEQIEMVFNMNRLLDAKEAMSPAKMEGFETNELLEMTADQFATAMEEAEDYQEKDYREYVKEQINEAYAKENEVYEALKRYDLPDSPNMITAIRELYANRNKAMRDLFNKTADDEEKSIEDIIADLTAKFGEACKTPEEMAEAERRLADLAENAMKNVIVEEEEISTIDLRGMKLIKTQIGAMQTMAEKHETYNIPIMVADEMGNMTLKIVRGKEQKGLVDIAFSTERTGNVRASFKYEAGSIAGSVMCDKNAIKDAFSLNSDSIIQNLREVTGLEVSFKAQYSGSVNASDIYTDEPDFENSNERNDVDTTVLYGLSRAFIAEFTKINF